MIIEAIKTIGLVAAIFIPAWFLLIRLPQIRLRRQMDAIRANPEAFESMAAESKYKVVMTEDQIHYLHPDGTAETIQWQDLESVTIQTTDEGPLHPDLFWRLEGAGTYLSIVKGATGEKELFERLQTLPGFDNEKIIDAMGSTSDQRFVLWERS